MSKDDCDFKEKTAASESALNDLLCEPVPPRLRDYLTCFGSGTVQVRMIIPGEYSNDDVDDLQEWLKIISRQIERLKT